MPRSLVLPTVESSSVANSVAALICQTLVPAPGWPRPSGHQISLAALADMRVQHAFCGSAPYHVFRAPLNHQAVPNPGAARQSNDGRAKIHQRCHSCVLPSAVVTVARLRKSWAATRASVVGRLKYPAPCFLSTALPPIAAHAASCSGEYFSARAKPPHLARRGLRVQELLRRPLMK